MFDKLFQKIFLTFAKTQVKKYVGQATETLKALNVEVTAENIVAVIEASLLKSKYKISVPPFVDNIADKALASFLDKVRDCAVDQLTKVK